MRIPQIRDPNLPPLDQLPQSYNAKVMLAITASVKKLLTPLAKD